MKENEKNDEDRNTCIDSISFSIISIMLFIFELISLIMSILCLVIIDWDFLKNFIKVLNIILKYENKNNLINGIFYN